MTSSTAHSLPDNVMIMESWDGRGNGHAQVSGDGVRNNRVIEFASGVTSGVVINQRNLKNYQRALS